MILQELLRNYIVYREVLKPLFESWKESFAVGQYKEVTGYSSSELNLALNKAKTLRDGEEFGWDISDEEDARSLSHITGTRTIASGNAVVWRDSDVFYEEGSSKILASAGRDAYVVLRYDQVSEYAVEIGKTYTHHFFLGTEFLMQNASKISGTTTGYESKQINFILSRETHEKREYLGEFSLTHEEIPLQVFFKKGGE
jgi:hypothetical protein